MNDNGILYRFFSAGFSLGYGRADIEEVEKEFKEVSTIIRDSIVPTNIKGAPIDLSKEVLEAAMEFRVLCEKDNLPSCLIYGIGFNLDVEKSYLDGKRYEQNRIAKLLGLGERK